MAKQEEYIGIGKRKCAVASVRLRTGNGKIKINGKDLKTYLKSESLIEYAMQPLNVTDSLKSFDLTVTIKGGGPAGQSGALRHGIARALIKFDETTRSVLKDCGMLTRDARVKERKKPGQPGARKRFQFSKR